VLHVQPSPTYERVPHALIRRALYVCGRFGRPEPCRQNRPADNEYGSPNAATASFLNLIDLAGAVIPLRKRDYAVTIGLQTEKPNGRSRRGPVTAVQERTNASEMATQAARRAGIAEHSDLAFFDGVATPRSFPVGCPAALQVSFRQACASASSANTSGAQFSLSAWRIRSCWLLGAMPPFGGSRSRLVGKE
jgi:hypothetical protein